MLYNFTIKHLEQGVFLDCMEAGLEAFKKKCTLFEQQNVFSTKALIGDTFFMSPISDRTAIYVVICSQAKVQPLRPYLQFSVILP